MLLSYGCLNHKKDTVIWGSDQENKNQTANDVNNFTYANLTYSQNTFNFVYGSEITPIAYLDSLGQIDQCLISPSLPSGLQMNSTDCKITGIPLQIVAATPYTITIKSGNIIYSKIINIEVLGFMCSSASLTATSIEPILYNGKYIVCNSNQLKKITEKNGIIASIHADINVGLLSEPLGSLSNIIIDGNNHTIFGEISDNSSQDVGLFSSLSDSKIQNLNLNLKISGLNNVGILAGKVKNSNIINILIDSNSEIVSSSSCAGLLFGTYYSDINFMQYLNVIALGRLNNASSSKSGLIACIPPAYLSSYSFDFATSFYNADNLGAISGNLTIFGKTTMTLQDPGFINLDTNYWDHSMGSYPQLKPIPSILINF